MLSKRDILKKVVGSSLTLLLLTMLLFLIFRDHLEEITAVLKSIPVWDVLWLCALGTLYQLLDGLACLILLRTTEPAIPYRKALEVIYLGVFGKTSTSGTGTIPMQAYDLYGCGIDVGRSVGIMTFSYALHKVTIVLCATLLLLIEGKWFYTAFPNLHVYLMAGYLICMAIAVVLLLLCAWRQAHDLALWVLNKLPAGKKWGAKKEKLQKQLDCLYDETSSFLKNRHIVMQVMTVHALKLMILCMLPYLCIRVLGVNSITLLQSELLGSLMLLIAGAAPNIAGMGPTEAVFFWLYKPFLGSMLTSSALLLFRIATYYVPFLVSIFVFLIVQMRLWGHNKSKEVQ